MDIDFKEILSLNCKWIFLLLGVVLGMLLSSMLISSHQNFSLIGLDLKKIIHAYSLATAKSTKPMHEIQKEFKAKFNLAIERIPAKNIVVTKGGLLSKHSSMDYTKAFIEIMEINKVNEQKSN